MQKSLAGCGLSVLPLNCAVVKRLSSGKSLPLHAGVVVCGGGLAGLSTAYHLVRHGINDVLLLEKDQIGRVGASRHSLGVISRQTPWQLPQVQRLAEYSNRFYQFLSQTHPDIDYKLSKTLYLARKNSSWANLQRMAAYAEAKKCTTTKLTAAQVYDMVPAVAESHELMGGILMEDEVKLNAKALQKAIHIEAAKIGVKIVENCEVLQVKIGLNGEVLGVETPHGFVRCHTFVNAAGMWSKKVWIDGGKTGVLTKTRLPSKACLYSYMTTNTFDLVPPDMPTIRDLDLNVWSTRLEHKGGAKLLSGGFNADACKAIDDALLPTVSDTSSTLPEDWDAFFPILEDLVQLFPGIRASVVDNLTSMLETYTPDAYMLMGEVPKYLNYFAIGGMCGNGTTLAGGAGEELAYWIRWSEPLERVVSKVDVARFLDMHTNKHYLRERTPEIVELSYKWLSPINQCQTARVLRTAPIYQRLKDDGAVFGELLGYERPMYFTKNIGERSEKTVIIPPEHSKKPLWFNQVASEYEACRERVALMDMSYFAKFEISSDNNEAFEFLQYICSADLNIDIGATVYTGMQNSHGGYVTDCTVTRLKPNHYFVIAPAHSLIRARIWFEKQKNLTGKRSLVIQDVTSMYTAMCVIGPASRHLMGGVTDQSVSSTDFPNFRCKEINVGFASNIRAISVTHTGELGWVLYVPNEFALHVYEVLKKEGNSLGMQHAGYLALRHLRIEKFFVFWGLDIDSTTTPLECGRGFRVNFDKGDFIGRTALLKQSEEGVKRRYVQLLLEHHHSDEDYWPTGAEPIYRNGEFVGRTTTAGYGFTLGCQIALGYVEHFDGKRQRQVVTNDWITDRDAVYEVDVAGKKFFAKVNLHSPQLPMMSSEHPDHYRPTQ